MRANLASLGSYFIFDFALIGLYGARIDDLTGKGVNHEHRTLGSWVLVLMAWPIILLLIPFQPIEVALVGLRGNILFLPILLLGARLRHEELQRLAVALAVLNTATLVVSCAEYFLGLERFYPHNAVTEMIYNMHDVAGYTAYRIPGTFSTPAGYCGTMIQTLPLVYGAWSVTNRSNRTRTIALLGLITALLGVLLGASRSAFVISSLSVLFVVGSGGITLRTRINFGLLLLCLGCIAASNQRLQRFTTLQDTDYVESRIAGSVNRTFWETLYEYPMGNGLGGGGTSIPYFWEGRVRRVVSLESEYSRIMLEQTPLGLLMWLFFIGWLMSRSSPFTRTAWREGRRLGWFVCLIGFGNGLIGIGMFTSVPQTLLMFLVAGWWCVRPPYPPGYKNRRLQATETRLRPGLPLRST
jgi:hypothetical protein